MTLSPFDLYVDRDVIIESLRKENQELRNQQTLTVPSRALALNSILLKNDSLSCNQQDYSLLVFNESARDGSKEEAILTQGFSSVRDSRTSRPDGQSAVHDITSCYESFVSNESNRYKFEAGR